MANSHPRVLITGVNGFVGQSVAPFLVERGYAVVGAGRSAFVAAGVEFVSIAKIDGFTDWSEALKNVDVVVHLAGRAHKMNETAEERHLYHETNVVGTLNLAKQALRAGVKKFVFISSIKAMLSDAHEEALTESFVCKPLEPYGLSKLEAEMELLKICQATGMKVVILRPPLIYGPGVKGNLASLIQLVRRLPILPLGGIRNRRSLLGVKNLASAIEAVIVGDGADGGVFLVSDGEDISTSELVQRFAEVYNPSCRIFALPAVLWRIMGALPFFAPRVARLTGSLPVDSSLFRQKTGWKAPFKMVEQLD